MRFLMGLAIMLWATCAFGGGGNLLKNGDFEDKDDPLAGWTVNYEWTENLKYMKNHTLVSVKLSDGMKRNVLTIATPTEESKVESPLIPFDADAHYRCTLDAKAEKGLPTRIYIAGYQFKPGVRPHENPHPGDLRMVYKGKAVTGIPSAWKSIELEFPSRKLSSAAQQHLKKVRFICLYVWTAQGVSIDNVRMTKVP